MIAPRNSSVPVSVSRTARTNGRSTVNSVVIGALVVAIRLWSGLPEGVMYAILLMNAMVPFINKATQPRIFGAKPAPVKEGAA